MRDDFPESVKRTLAARAGHRCSNPECRAQTSGPQVVHAKALNVGVAAHIMAASEGGPRFDASLTAEDRSGIENAMWLCQTCAKLVDNDADRYSVPLLRQWKAGAESEALKTIGKARRSPNTTSREPEAQIRRNLQLKRKMHRDFLKPAAERRPNPLPRRPYEKLAHSEVIVHSLDDTSYPNIDTTPGIGSWFKVEVYDFYHNGLEVILGLERGIMDAEGRWRILRYDEDYDPARCREIKIWVIGCIPWRNIREYDLDGDEYYVVPHIYCAFDDNGTPYEDTVFAMLDEDYDWPLEKDKRIEASS